MIPYHKEENKCPKHGVVHKNGGYDSCPEQPKGERPRCKKCNKLFLNGQGIIQHQHIEGFYHRDCTPTPPQSDWEEKIINEYLKVCEKNSIKTGYHQNLETTIVSDWWLSKLSQVEKKSYEEGKREERKRIVKNIEDRKIDISQPQNAFNLIVNEGSDVGGQVYGYNKALDDVLEYLTKTNK